MKQIFVRGVSRSGGTLMVTILDAHPHVAMSYEIYEHLLHAEDSSQNVLDDLRAQLQDALAKQSVFRKDPARRMTNASLRTFVLRAQRAGIQPANVLELAEQHRAEGMDFQAFEGRMRFIERLARAKAKMHGKLHWGVKIEAIFDCALAMYPQAYFLFMRRDGRDIAASRKLVGNFRQTVQHVAESWCEQIDKFERFANRPGVRAYMVNYEQLTTSPETELRSILHFLDLPWDDRILHFHDEDLTLYHNPTGHLSAEQVKQPINTASIGRWRRDLTVEELREFESIAGPTLERFGYELSQPRRAAAALS
jgi:hypothetical protein